MQTFLLVSNNADFIGKEIEKKKKQFQITPFNLYELTPSPSIGIEEVRKIERNITLKPYGGGSRIIIIKGMEKATPEAGNALLKILEEPPPDNYIILTVDSLNRLLPTIVSRCQIISEYRHNAKSDDSNTFNNIHEILAKIIISSAGERIFLSKNLIKSRDEAVKFLDLFITVLENYLYNPPENLGLSINQIAKIINKAMAARNYLEKNINFKATLDIFFLGLPKLN